MLFVVVTSLLLLWLLVVVGNGSSDVVGIAVVNGGDDIVGAAVVVGADVVVAASVVGSDAVVDFVGIDVFVNVVEDDVDVVVVVGDGFVCNVVIDVDDKDEGNSDVVVDEYVVSTPELFPEVAGIDVIKSESADATDVNRRLKLTNKMTDFIFPKMTLKKSQSYLSSL